MNHIEFATKLAFVPDVGSVTPTGTRSSYAMPSTLSIGDKKPPVPTPPATLAARSVSGVPSTPSAPRVPRPGVNDAQAASRSMTPLTKTSSGDTNEPMRKLKKAPRYSSRGRKGKKVMPLPHATRIKKAQDFGVKLAEDYQPLPFHKQEPLSPTLGTGLMAGGGAGLGAFLGDFLSKSQTAPNWGGAIGAGIGGGTGAALGMYLQHQKRLKEQKANYAQQQQPQRVEDNSAGNQDIKSDQMMAP